jgi:transcriptional regulator with XRE-family HTH domain
MSVILAENVRRLRIERGWTQVEFSELLGRPQSRVSEIERAVFPVSTTVIDELADAFGVKQVQLLAEHKFSEK